MASLLSTKKAPERVEVVSGAFLCLVQLFNEAEPEDNG